MKRFSVLGLALLMLWAIPSRGQYKPEREHRIKKSQFPEAAIALVEARIPDARRKRYYRETDSSFVSYRVKFRKERLQYRAFFGKEGRLQAMDIGITPTDVPDETMERMMASLDIAFSSYKIHAMRQQYVLGEGESMETLLRNTFQNLLLPDVRYELQLSGKEAKGGRDYEVTFDAEGNLIGRRRALPPNYDHVLY